MINHGVFLLLLKTNIFSSLLIAYVSVRTRLTYQLEPRRPINKFVISIGDWVGPIALYAMATDVVSVPWLGRQVRAMPGGTLQQENRPATLNRRFRNKVYVHTM